MANTFPKRLLVKNRKILLRVSEKSDYERVLHFLRQHFYPFDRSSHGRISKRQSAEDEVNEMKSIDSGASVLAFTDDDKEELVGLYMARGYQEEECRENLARLKKLSALRGYPNDLEGVIFTEEMKIRSQICRHFCTNRAFYLSVAAIREDFQRLSLAQQLMQQSVNCGKYLEYSVAFGLSVTTRGIRLMEKLNFQPIYCTNYVDYQDYRGLSIYNHFPSQLQAKIFAKSLI